MALSDAFNKELHDLADAGCPVIQIEDPQLHLLAARPVATSACWSKGNRSGASLNCLNRALNQCGNESLMRRTDSPILPRLGAVPPQPA